MLFFVFFLSECSALTGKRASQNNKGLLNQRGLPTEAVLLFSVVPFVDKSFCTPCVKGSKQKKEEKGALHKLDSTEFCGESGCFSSWNTHQDVSDSPFFKIK